jgi:hypothetical protein
MFQVLQNTIVPQARPVRVLKAHSLAHMTLDAGAKAALASAWLTNKLVITPTVELAALTFRVSQQAVTQHRKQQDPASLPAGMLAFGLLTATPDERAAVFAQYESLIWAGLEHVSDHQR